MQEHIFERMARERNISVEEMRAIISNRIEKAGMTKIRSRENNGEKFPVLGIFRRRTNGYDMQLKESKKMVERIY